MLAAPVFERRRHSRENVRSIAAKSSRWFLCDPRLRATDQTSFTYIRF
jgi:hypothetical protein